MKTIIKKYSDIKPPRLQNQTHKKGLFIKRQIWKEERFCSTKIMTMMETHTNADKNNNKILTNFDLYQ